MEPLLILAAIVFVAAAAIAIKVKRMRADAHHLMARGHDLARKASRTPAEDEELAGVSRRLVATAGPLLDYRLKPLDRLRWLPADTYQLVTTGLDGTESPPELEDFVQVVAFVHLGGGSGSVTAWSDQALQFARGHYDTYHAAEIAAGSDEATADRVARAKAGDLAGHYFPFAIHRTGAT